MDIKLILEFKNSFGKYHPVFPKNHKKVFFGTCCMCTILLYIKYMLCLCLLCRRLYYILYILYVFLFTVANCIYSKYEGIMKHFKS